MFTASQARSVNILHNSEQPASSFAVLDTGTCLVADTLFDIIFLKLKDFYICRKNNRIETKGQRYELGDFVIKVGSAIISGSVFKGVLVEVKTGPHFEIVGEVTCACYESFCSFYRLSSDPAFTRVSVGC